MRKMICEMNGNRLLRDKPEEIDLSADSPAVRLYRALRDTVLGDCRRFTSCDLPHEDKAQEEMEWEALAPPSSKKEVDLLTRSKQALTEYLRKKTEGQVMDLANLCWKHRELFRPIRPGSVKSHYHRIDLNTQKDLRARIYPLRNESQREAARKEIDEILKGGMIQPVEASSF